MNTVLDLLGRYKYVAMFSVLFLCGLGLPLPEEVTLIASGMAVGWAQADFVVASAVCVLGILAGDMVVFGLGRWFGQPLLATRFMRFVLPQKRQDRVSRFFRHHGSKTVFFARFFAGLRIGVYFYAGQHGMKLWRFLAFDLAGALISGPTSIWVGKFAASQIADPHEASRFAARMLHRGQSWIYMAVGLLIVVMLVHALYNRRRDRLLNASRRAINIPPVIAMPSLQVPAANSDSVGHGDATETRLPILPTTPPEPQPERRETGI